MSGQIMWGKFFFFGSLIMVGGWGVMRVTTPTEQQFYDALAPDLKKKVDDIRRQREGGAALKETLANAGNSDKIVWAEDLSATTTGRKV
ncbi:hypothetical protein P7C73_g5331, partial [Tremellales sp. Uapishka_1]